MDDNELYYLSSRLPNNNSKGQDSLRELIKLPQFHLQALYTRPELFPGRVDPRVGSGWVGSGPEY